MLSIMVLKYWYHLLTKLTHSIFSDAVFQQVFICDFLIEIVVVQLDSI